MNVNIRTQFIIKVQIITPKCGQSVNVEYNIVIPSIEILLKLWIIYFALNCAQCYLWKLISMTGRQGRNHQNFHNLNIANHFLNLNC